MIDRIKFKPHGVYLNREAVRNRKTTLGWCRRTNTKGEFGPHSLSLRLLFDYYPLVTVISRREANGSWRVDLIDTNLGRLIHGHNCRPVRNATELLLSLTRLKHFVSQVVTPESRGRIIPGVGESNLGYIWSAEIMQQIQDPAHELLLASHVARRRYQHGPALVAWGESTLFKGEETELSIYDKAAQRGRGSVLPVGIPGTRVEFRIKNPERLAKEVLE